MPGGGRDMLRPAGPAGPTTIPFAFPAPPGKVGRPVARLSRSARARPVSAKDEMTSVNRLLLKTIWPFVLVVAIVLTMTIFCIDLLSSIRAYVAAESQWSKGQKDAIYYLERYADTGAEGSRQKYLTAIAAPLAYHRARLALE